MTHTISTADTLNLAADLIEKRGWVRGTGWRDNGGLCLEGGIIAALGWKWSTHIEGLSYYSDPTTEFEQGRCPAYNAVRAYLDSEIDPEDIWGGRLWVWNDDQETPERVIEVLRAVAVIEAARETELAEVTC